MKRRTWMRSVFFLLILPVVLAGQSRAYAKFDANGEPMGLYNLMKDPSSCPGRQVFDGVVAVLHSWEHPKEAEYRFAVDMNGGQRIARIRLGVDDIPGRDIRRLIRRKQAVRIRGCRKGVYWMVEEITRR